MHFYEFNIGDYAKKTQHLTNEEDLAYRRLLDMYYDTEKPIANPLLTDGLATLSRRLRVSEQALKNVLEEFFPEGRNKHADEKIAEYHAFIARQQANGKLGGRKKKTQAKPNANPKKPSANPDKPTANPSPGQPLTTKPLTINQPVNTREAFQMLPGWEPSTHLADMAKQANAKITQEGQQEFIAYWLSRPDKRTQAEWDKALLQSAIHKKLDQQSKQGGKQPAAENFASRDYGTGVQVL